MAITITWNSTREWTDHFDQTHTLRVGTWYIDGEYAGDIETPLVDGVQTTSDEILIHSLENNS